MAEKTKPRTCLDCGFLTIEGCELSVAERIMLVENVGVSLKNPERARCFKKLWVIYDLTYYEDCFQGVRDELNRSRENCIGYLLHQPGFTPKEHLQFQSNALNNPQPRPIAPPKGAERKRTSGRPRVPEVKKRREILRQIIKNLKELSDRQKQLNLFAALERDKIPIPGNSKKSIRWLELLHDPARKPELESTLINLRRDFDRS